MSQNPPLVRLPGQPQGSGEQSSPPPDNSPRPFGAPAPRAPPVVTPRPVTPIVRIETPPPAVVESPPLVRPVTPVAPLAAVISAWPLQRDCDAFYGNPRGTNGGYSTAWASEFLTHVFCPWQIQIGGKTVPYITINKKCAASLERVLSAIWNACDRSQDKINALHYNVYDGSFNYRLMRDGHSLSMHGYGCAMDWDAAENPFHNRHHLFQSGSLLVVKFEDEGWVWGGDWSDPDAMHVQAARVHS